MVAGIPYSVKIERSALIVLAHDIKGRCDVSESSGDFESPKSKLLHRLMDL